MVKRRYWNLMIWIGCFLFGSYVWKIFHTGTLFLDRQTEETQVDDIDFTVNVGEYLITRQDIEWEYNFYMQQLNLEPSLEGEKGLSNLPIKPISQLYNKIMADLIERKLLYQYIAIDSRFNRNDAARFTNCLKQWQATLDEHAEQFVNDQARMLLKSMLCEKDILEQYLKEEIVSKIDLNDAEIRSYYMLHKSEFNQPTRVILRQVVLASENAAKKVQGRINLRNFEQLAREFSISPEAKVGGLLGPFARGELPSVFGVAFDMRVGEIQGILKSTYGFHIIMLEKRLPKAELGFELAEVQIRRILLKKRQDEEYKKWVEIALNTIPIKSHRTL